MRGMTSNEEEQKSPVADSSEYPLELIWNFGLERNVAVYNISRNDKKEVLYASGNVAIAYDWAENEQTFFEGHVNDIDFIATSPDNKWIVTSDKGADNSIIVWDSETRSAVKVEKGKFQDGVAHVCFSSCGKRLLILDRNSPQHLYLWRWQSRKFPPALHEFASDIGFQHYGVLHYGSWHHFTTNGKKEVVFFEIEDDGLVAHMPEFDPKVFVKAVGNFTQTAYFPHSEIVGSATTLGNVLLWGNEVTIGLRIIESVFVSPLNRIPSRLMQPHAEKDSILVLKVFKSWLVAANSSGFVYFYDAHMRAVWGHRELKCGPIKEISFRGEANVMEGKTSSLEIAIPDPECFVHEDFVLSTVGGYCGYYYADKDKVVNIIQDWMHEVKAIAVHPIKPYVCLGDCGGRLQMWNYETKTLENMQHVKGSCREISCLEYDSSGDYLACGLTDGRFFIFDVPVLTETPNFQFSVQGAEFTMCKFSPDSQFLTIVDSTCAISLVRLYCVLSSWSLLQKKTDVPMKEKPKWELLCRDRHHYKKIIDIEYNIPVDDKDDVLLFTLAEDRNLVIYNVTDSAKDEISVIDVLLIENLSIPTCLSFYPLFDKTTVLAIANDEYKLKIHDWKDESAIKCFQVSVLPIYDSPLRKIFLLQCEIPESIRNQKAEENGEASAVSSEEEVKLEDEAKEVEQMEEPEDEEMEQGETEAKFYVFRTDCSIGIMALPYDGNPHSVMAIRTHPRKISDIKCDPSGKYLFSCGLQDSWVYMWRMNPWIVYYSKEATKGEIAPFLKLLGHEEPTQIRDEVMMVSFSLQLQRLENQFPLEIKLENRILLCDLNYVMVYLGYYPSNYEMALLIKEANFDREIEEGTEYDAATINLEEVIKLYVNHRPIKPITADVLEEAFKTLSGVKDDDPLVPRDHFIKCLEENGEPMTENELLRCLMILEDRRTLSSIEAKYIQLDKDPNYYCGEEVEPTQEYSISKSAETESIDWGDLDEEDDIVESGVEDDDADSLESTQGRSDTESPCEKESTEESPKKQETLRDILPTRISKKFLVSDLLGFPSSKEQQQEAAKEEGNEETANKK